MRYTIPFLLVFILLLSACSPTLAEPIATPTPDSPATLSAMVAATLATIPTATLAPTATLEPTPSVTPTEVIPADVLSDLADLTLSDRKGAVVVSVTPLDLENPAGAIAFEVAMNTHSVDLSMDLAELATLKTDAGLAVTPLSWDGMAGGHHVSGTLVFPAQIGGKHLLEGTSTLTLVIKNVDAPERIFTWQVGSP